MTQNITSVLVEKRVFKPRKEFSAQAHIKSMAQYQKMYRESIKSPDKFFGKMAQELSWFKPWKKVSEWKAPFAKWFIGGKTNMSFNCLDRHIQNGKKNKVALIWEGEPGEVRHITYGELLRETNRCCNALAKLGVKKGDRVMIYMPMVPEAVVAMLACTRMGAPHTVVFGGFSSEAVKDRIHDCQASCVITADGGYRRGAVVELKKNVDVAVEASPMVKNVLVLQRTKNEVTMTEGRDHWWHETVAKASDEYKAAELDSEHPLFILYTSGSTGKPKGILHTTGGYMLGAYLTTKYVFDIHDDDIFWCTADIGWITGHSYTSYGALLNGATSVIYEGAPNQPQPDRFWQIVDKHAVTILYTAPTAIRAFMKWGDEWVKPYSLKTLRLLGTVGEPINPEAWICIIQ